ncbi:MAG: pentapeptide repeat-containing protein [Desulfohalobiaceae bacterium]|nr:pentapeptide repeat-containing protein [Desulfohalobiaceae bacterium]
MADKKRNGKPLWLEITGTLLTPVVIAIASYYVTYKINEQQQENAKRIAEAQIQNSMQISEGEVNVAKLDQIKDMFSMIFREKPDIPKNEVILSLPAYGMVSLPFLTRALEYSKALGDKKLIECSNQAITLVLGSSQLNLSGLDMTNLSLRNAHFNNLDLRRVDFSGSNLYKADLDSCNLVGSKFENADLYLANFSGANLTNAVLTGSNLRRADFTGAKLDNVNFKDTRHIEDAEFSPSALKDPVFDKADAAKLIKKYREAIDRDQFGEDLLMKLKQKYELDLERLGG